MTPTNQLTAHEKKRLRDRRAQRALREKRERQLRMLEERIAYCEKNHQQDTQQDQEPGHQNGPQQEQQQQQHHDQQRLLDTIRALQKENRILQSRQKGLTELVNSWQDTSLPAADNPQTPSSNTSCLDPLAADILLRGILKEPLIDRNMAANSAEIQRPLPPQSTLEYLDSPESIQFHYPDPVEARIATAVPSSPGLVLAPFAVPEAAAISLEQPITPHSSTASSVSLDLTSPSSLSASLPALPLPLAALPAFVPAWTLIPPVDVYSANIDSAMCPWLKRPDLVVSCPNIPNALDLLHGTRRNFLANSIHWMLRGSNCREPEILAMGWLIYLYSKWLVSPSPGTYANMPPFMRPVLGQLQKAHPRCCDQICFPRLRLNFIHRVPREKLLEPVEFLSCCLRVRWKWGENILERDHENSLRVRQEFYNTFTSENGWGLTSMFIDKFPDIVAGMDISSVLYTPT